MPDPGVIEWLWESFNERQAMRRNFNPSSRMFIGLLHDHAPDCRCEEVGSWYSNEAAGAHSMIEKVRTVMHGDHVIPVEPHRRPPWLHSHP